MVAGERHAHHRGDGEVALGVDDRTLLPCPDGQDHAFGRIDDRREILDAEHAEIGDGERAAGIFLWLQLALAGAGGEVFHLFGNLGEAFAFSVEDDRRDQAAINGDSNRNIGVRVIGDAIVRVGCIAVRFVHQGHGAGLD